MAARVLLVDDDDASRMTIEALLLPEKHDLTTFAFAREVLEWMDQNPCPDLLLSDVMMPDMDGLELCRQVRARPDTSALPIILVTALDQKEDLIRGLEAGADEFLSKPLNGAELRTRVRTMLRIKRQQDSLRDAMTLREDLTRLIVHDMRNPLAAIQIYLQILLKKHAQSDPQLREDLSAALAESQHINEMVNDMLVAARMEHGNLTLDRAPCRLGAIVRAACEAPFLEDHRARLQVDSWEEEPEALWDERMLRRVLDNLLTNAVKYTPGGKPIHVSIGSQNGQLRLVVRDEGPGIPEEHRERIFDKFGVVPMKHSGAKQTGLGLYFCRLVAEAHGGTIRAEPGEVGGTAFILELPVVPA